MATDFCKSNSIGKKIAFKKKCPGGIGHQQAEKLNSDLNHTPNTEINSKQIKDLNIKRKTIKFLEKKMGENL